MLSSLNLRIDEKNQKVFVSFDESIYAITFWFTREDVRGLLDTAFYGGINSWCTGIRFDDDAYKLHMIAPNKYGLTAYDRFLQFGKMYVLDVDKEIHVLTTEQFFDAIEKCGKLGMLPMEYYSNAKYARIDVCNIDVEIADLIFQTAVFGELIYS